jgi:outer membrane protein TolC
LDHYPSRIENAIKQLPHDQYRITVDVNQVIYDGGTIKGQRNLEKAELKVNEMQTETDLYKLRTQINGYYFNILLLDRQKELLEAYFNLVEKRLRSVQTAIENGVLSKTDADILTSEKINLMQQLSENEIRKKSLLKVLSDLTGMQIEATAEFMLPVRAAGQDEEITRPELQLIELRKELLTAGEALTESRRMPKAFGFATLGYGNPPGNNFFRDEFDTYYILGAGIKWNIFDWNKTRNENR